MINPACISSRHHSSSVPYKPARVALEEGKQNCVCAVRLPVLLALPWGVFEVSSERTVIYSMIPNYIILSSYTKAQFPEFEEGRLGVWGKAILYWGV